jgi:hypothetical protein
MARKKNNDSTPAITLGTTEDTQVINSADIEATEADLLSDKEEESHSEETTKAESSTEPLVEKSEAKESEPKPKRQRRSKKAATAQDIVSIDANATEIDLSKEVTLAKEAVELTMSAMVAQFTTIKELTSSVNSQLEKMNSLIKEMSPNQSSNLEELVKPQSNYNFIAKFATAASLVAMLFSLLSMSMSQSARQTLLSASLNNQESNSVQSTNSSPELAVSNKENVSKRKLKK